MRSIVAVLMLSGCFTTRSVTVDDLVAVSNQTGLVRSSDALPPGARGARFDEGVVKVQRRSGPPLLLDAPVEARVEAGSLALTNVARVERVAYRDVEAIENRVYWSGATVALAIVGSVLLSGAMATAIGVVIFEAGMAGPSTGCWCW